MRSAVLSALRRRLFSGLLLLACALAPAAAQAHAMLLATSPADEALLRTPPAHLTLTFNEPVRPLSLRLIGPEGAALDLTAEASGGLELRIPFPQERSGTQILNWRVVSEDGHPIAGALLFSVGEVTGAASGVREAVQSGPILRGAIWAARALMLIGLTLGIGGALFRAFAGLPPEAEAPIRLLIPLGMAASAAFLGLHGLDALGLDLSALASPAPWAAGWSTSFGPTVALAILAGAVALAGARRPAAGWLAAGLLALGFAASGHAAAAAPQALTRPLVAGHALALTFWLGALIPLALWMKRADGAAALRRFSRAIPWAVVLLGGTGFGLAAIQLGPNPALWPSPYGSILAAKLALLALVFALAAYNRLALTKPALAGEAQAAARLGRSIRMETGLVLLVLALAAGWRFTPPPRALADLAAAPAPAVTTHFGTGEAMADVTFTPGGPGRIRVEILPYDGEMLPSEPMAVTLGLAHEGHGLNRRTWTALRGEDGVWRVEKLLLPHRGVWALDLEIRLTRFKRVRIAGEIAIP
ncbi:copper resistance CopC/CopD family protein [Neomegalonema perideroedes]|uniref:copper resistance CopC/CopD family protein n=1 Tax=Neomegalonema perideroedes TaxID=217219 RepID=UPI00036FD8E8|nr:CopD family protein [Neomegalonema perideroedes]